ncbi:hypothetical protein T492DRAFT_548084 [Pavlovales sp. CCMP2436]|nr:hypothetical protein T492DRAFT_548084 [Pavlovales sp. CCMP2436]
MVSILFEQTKGAMAYCVLTGLAIFFEVVDISADGVSLAKGEAWLQIVAWVLLLAQVIFIFLFIIYLFIICVIFIIIIFCTLHQLIYSSRAQLFKTAKCQSFNRGVGIAHRAGKLISNNIRNLILL